MSLRAQVWRSFVMISVPRIGIRHLIAGYAASLSLACSSSSPAPATNTNPVDSGGESDATMTSPTDAGTGEPDTGTAVTPDTGTVAEGGTAALSCTSYCAAVMSACTGANAQYQSTDACMNACPNFPVGMAGDTSGNTLGCRTTHAMFAASMGTNPHCWHAGPYGYGACGDECAGFCTLATTWCTPAGGFGADAGAPPYASDSACLTACAGYKQIDSADAGVGLDGGYNAQGPASGNTLDCREYHLGASLAGGAMQQLHCQHPGMTSPTCF
jgi:hypothetical protein